MTMVAETDNRSILQMEILQMEVLQMEIQMRMELEIEIDCPSRPPGIRWPRQTIDS